MPTRLLMSAGSSPSHARRLTAAAQETALPCSSTRASSCAISTALTRRSGVPHTRHSSPTTLTRKLGPRWARGSEPWPARWRGCGVALVVRRGGPGCRVGGGSGTRGQGLWSGAGCSGGLRGADGDGGSAAWVELLQLALQECLALLGGFPAGVEGVARLLGGLAGP